MEPIGDELAKVFDPQDEGRDPNWVWGFTALPLLAVVISAEAALGPATAMETNYLHGSNWRGRGDGGICGTCTWIHWAVSD
jgi:hypothetical protein